MEIKETIRFLNNLYYSKYQHDINSTIEVEIDKSMKKYTKKYVNDNTDNIIFMDRHAGPYCKKLEAEVSLTKKKLKKINLDNFTSVYHTWRKHGNLTKEMHEQFNRATLISLHKKGDKSEPSNYRYLYNFTNIIKLLDKIWSIEICKELTGKINDKNFLSYHTRYEFNDSMRGMATKFTNSNNNKIMLDFMKAFDNVTYDSIKKLMKSFLIRKLGKEKGDYYFTRYFNIITNSNIFHEKIKIKRNKGIPTGLPSSNIVFTMIMEEIFYQFIKIKPEFNKHFNFYVYVDDIAIEILDNNINIKSYIDTLLKLFDYYMFKCNPKKCLISENIKDNYENFQIINEDTKYLGIYFTRNPKVYIDNIINEYNEKKNKNFKFIHEMINHNKNSARLYLKYKLTPFTKNK